MAHKKDKACMKRLVFILAQKKRQRKHGRYPEDL